MGSGVKKVETRNNMDETLLELSPFLTGSSPAPALWELNV